MTTHKNLIKAEYFATTEIKSKKAEYAGVVFFIHEFIVEHKDELRIVQVFGEDAKQYKPNHYYRAIKTKDYKGRKTLKIIGEWKD